MVCTADESKDKYEHLKETVNEELKKAFRPEFLNRIDDIIVFAHLNKTEIREIVDLMFKDLLKRIEAHEFKIEVTDEVKDYLAEEGYSEAYGARPLRRVIQKKIEDTLAEEILNGKYVAGDTIRAELVDKKIVFEKVGAKKEKEKKEQPVSVLSLVDDSHISRSEYLHEPACGFRVLWKYQTGDALFF